MYPLREELQIPSIMQKRSDVQLFKYSLVTLEVGSVKKPDPDDVRSFRKKLDESKINPESVAVHMPYLPNLSAPDGVGYEKSVEILFEELDSLWRLTDTVPGYPSWKPSRKGICYWD